MGSSTLPAMADEAFSPLAEALARVGDRWTLLVVEALLGGARRFSDIQDAVGDIAPNILSQRMKKLEREGLVVARRYSERPPRFEYLLTEPGRELADALRLLAQWGSRRSDAAEAPHHRACGTGLETRWYCPTCDRVAADEESSDVRYV